MNFSEKNNFIVKHTSEKHVLQDLQLLLKVNPTHPVLRERPNQFNLKKIDGSALDALLNAGVKPADILENREAKVSEDKKESQKDFGKSDSKTSGDQASEGGESSEAQKEKQKVQKDQEFPKIKWDNISDPNVQLAVLLYDDRVKHYRKAKELDSQLDEKPELAEQYQEHIIQNKMADNELQSYNDTGNWIGEHALCSRVLMQSRLERMNTADLAKEYAAAKQNASRYKSQIKNKKYKDEEQRKAWAEHQKRYEEMIRMIVNLQNTTTDA